MKPTDNLRREFRGGSWYNSSATVVRGARLGGNAPSLRDDLVGFRTAQTGCRQILKGDAPP